MKEDGPLQPAFIVKIITPLENNKNALDIKYSYTFSAFILFFKVVLSGTTSLAFFHKNFLLECILFMKFSLLLTIDLMRKVDDLFQLNLFVLSVIIFCIQAPHLL